MFKWILRAAVALVAARVAAKYVHPAPEAAENPSPYKAKPKEEADFGKRGKRMQTASGRKRPATAAETKH